MIPAPAPDSPDRGEWEYGAWKRDAEDRLAAAYARSDFPCTALRLPMIHSERDHYGRIRGYLLRLRDGGPIVVPDEPLPPVRHVYAGDVVRLLMSLLARTAGVGDAFNVGADEALPLDQFLGLLAAAAGAELRLVRAPRAELQRRGLLPGCSPFSGRWMSELDNRRSRLELGAEYRAPAEYLPRLVAFHDGERGELAGYRARPAELAAAAEYG